jgi:hypothetical protein
VATVQFAKVAPEEEPEEEEPDEDPDDDDDDDDQDEELVPPEPDEEPEEEPDEELDDPASLLDPTPCDPGATRLSQPAREPRQAKTRAPVVRDRCMPASLR